MAFRTVCVEAWATALGPATTPAVPFWNAPLRANLPPPCLVFTDGGAAREGINA